MGSTEVTKRKRIEDCDQVGIKRSKTAWTSGQQLTPCGTSTASRASSPVQDNEEEGIILARASRILAIETAALSSVNVLYHTDHTARRRLLNAVNAITACHRRRNKLILCGVGKSAYIAQKLVATCKSLGIRSSFLHACEAAHGDLGDVDHGDVLMFVTFSGKTPELLNLLPHLPDGVQLMALCGKSAAEECKVLDGRKDSILLPAPIPESEESCFGVCAPTISTTVALAVGDMVALSVAEQLHESAKREVFQRNHPGGAIGQQVTLTKAEVNVEVTLVDLPSPYPSAEDDY